MKKSTTHAKLGQLASTAICGNDITSSCLYVSALAIFYGGRWGPLSLVIVAVVLYFYRSIYAEVVGALPLNGGIWLLHNGVDTLWNNLSIPVEGGWKSAIFFGFCAAMLGISGFESSANFVEEQADGVFPKTLRNMWLAVSIINPVIALLALALLPIASIEVEQEALLTNLGGLAGGKWLATVISVDAVLVLSGAVLTSFVGVNGLVHRMALDRCLPQFLLKTNRRGTTHRILVIFFVLCVSVYFCTRGELKALAGVYTISFLSVMALFAVGNILLKLKRRNLARPHRASWPSVIFGLIAVVAALIGNAVLNPFYLGVFLEFLFPTLIVVSFMLGRVALLEFGLFLIHSVMATLSSYMGRAIGSIQERIQVIKSQQIIFFTRGDNLANLNKAIVYIRRNEHTNRVKIVHISTTDEPENPRLKKDIEFLNEAYPDVDVELVIRKGTFGPKLIAALSDEWKTPPNLMFIGSPEGGDSIQNLAEFGGVRLII